MSHPKAKNDFQESTKRKILSKVNSVYDPLGLASPLTVRAKNPDEKIVDSQPKIGME